MSDKWYTLPIFTKTIEKQNELKIINEVDNIIKNIIPVLKKMKSDSLTKKFYACRYVGEENRNGKNIFGGHVTIGLWQENEEFSRDIKEILKELKNKDIVELNMDIDCIKANLSDELYELDELKAIATEAVWFDDNLMSQMAKFGCFFHFFINSAGTQQDIKNNQWCAEEFKKLDNLKQINPKVFNKITGYIKEWLCNADHIIILCQTQ